MRVSIKRDGKIINIIIADDMNIAKDLYPGCTVMEETEGDYMWKEDGGESEE